MSWYWVVVVKSGGVTVGYEALGRAMVVVGWGGESEAAGRAEVGLTSLSYQLSYFIIL